MSRLRVAWLPDGKRLHLHDGTIDLIVRAFGRPAEVGRAYEAGIARARVLMEEVARDVALLQAGLAPEGAAGRRAVAASDAVPGALGALTALAGAAADEVMQAMMLGGRIARGFVNNQGLLAFHVTEGHGLQLNMMDWAAYPRYEANVPLVAAMRSRGVAAAGWGFTPYALGWVERVFAAAPSAAVAQAAAGAIAAAMRPARGGAPVPAASLAADCMLGALPVYARRALSGEEAAAMIAQGEQAAGALAAAGVIALAVAEAGERSFLAGPPHFTLKSFLSLEAGTFGF